VLSGEGAVGKSILLMQLASATVLGCDWINTLPQVGPVIYLSCEDDEDEIRRRLEAITSHYGSTRTALMEDGLTVYDFVGKDATLGQPVREIEEPRRQHQADTNHHRHRGRCLRWQRKQSSANAPIHFADAWHCRGKWCCRRAGQPSKSHRHFHEHRHVRFDRLAQWTEGAWIFQDATGCRG
jgi:hypothetical protein